MSVVYRCVNKKKNDEKGYFFRAGQCASLSSFRVGKCYFYRKRVYCFTILQKVAKVRVCVLIYYIGKG